MRKSLLTAVAIATTCSAFAYQKADISRLSAGPKVTTNQSMLTRADGEMESFDFSYASDPYSGYSLNGATGGTTRVYLAFEMAASDVKTFAGSKVTGFSVYSPFDSNFSGNTITDARFFYSFDLLEEAYSQDFNMTKTAANINNISIDEPYTITGEEDGIVFGYSFVVPKKNNMYYLLTDGIANDPATGIYAMTNEETFPTEFYTFGSDIGALCMSITLECEVLPKFVSFASFPASICLPLGQPSSLPITLKATSGSPVESVEIEYTFAGNTQNTVLTFDPAVPAGAARYISTNLEFPAYNEKYKETVEFKLTKINGIENIGAGTTTEADVVVVNEVPVHQTLIEEYTGTWCGWCTRGYAALEYMRENYPDFVVAAFHNDDPMAITDAYPSQINGFPSAVLNRNTLVDPYYGTQTYSTELPIVGDILALNAVPTVWSVKVDHTWVSDDELVAKAEVANLAGFENKTYNIVYLLVADGLSGTGRNWFQSNYYSTETPQYIPQLNAFCKGGEYGKSSVGGLIFNDVVISTTGIYGEEGSIPSSLAAEEVAEHSLSFDLTAIPEDLIADKNKLRVIAAVVDAAGNVLNCAKDEVDDFTGTAVEGIESATKAPVEYYDLTGRKVANPEKGIFIKKVGTKSEKVIIP